MISQASGAVARVACSVFHYFKILFQTKTSESVKDFVLLIAMNRQGSSYNLVLIGHAHQDMLTANHFET